MVINAWSRVWQGGQVVGVQLWDNSGPVPIPIGAPHLPSTQAEVKALIALYESITGPDMEELQEVG